MLQKELFDPNVRLGPYLLLLSAVQPLEIILPIYININPMIIPEIDR